MRRRQRRQADLTAHPLHLVEHLVEAVALSVLRELGVDHRRRARAGACAAPP